MTNQRTITLLINTDDQAAIAEITSHDRLFSVIGSLSTWNMRYAHVTISGGVFDGNPELLATYRVDADAPSVGYTICAVWHGDHFESHS